MTTHCGIISFIMDDKFLSPYDPQENEENIYKKWEDSGFFNPDKLPERHVEPFSTIMPPPNANGRLHAGHALDMTLKDVMTRFERMRGKKALFLPGADHAGFETQMVFEKKLSKEGKSRFHMKDDELYKAIWDFTMENKKYMESDLRRLGISCDWSRNTFTLDPKIVENVQKTFVKMYNDDLVYRGDRIIHWNPKFKTSLSEVETEFIEQEDPFYYLQYGPFVIATVRPETKFGDKYVVMHPDDERYKEYEHGQKIDLEWINGPITATIIKDDSIDMEFGTGVMTITPWHSQVDFDIAERHGLDKEQIIDFGGLLLPIAGEFEGVHINKARPLIVEKLKEKGLLVKVEENYKHNVRICERTKVPIEPQIKSQWFVKMKPLADMVIDSVEKKNEINILPDHQKKILLHWMHNTIDWNISRQIVWGIPIPAWFDKDGDVHLPTTKTFLLARHGESEANKNGTVAGHEDSPLTEKGIEQANEFATILKSKNISKIISSDLSRSKDTAEIIARELGLTVEVWKELREIDYGELVGKAGNKTKSNLQAISELDCGESLEDLETRSKTVWEKLNSVEADGDILVVGHRTFNSILVATNNGLTSEKFIAFRENFDLENASTLKIEKLVEPKGDLTRDPDTFDTWFSSGQWPLLTLGYPDGKDFKEFYPTDVMETGSDLVFKWVPRMIIFGLYLANKIPFKTVYFHGMVNDEKNKKMSKSKGNVVSPIDISDKFGTDALRMSLLIGNPPGGSIPLSENKVRGYKHFANKIWNASRFVLSNVEGADLTNKPELTKENQKHLDDFNEKIKEITKNLEVYRIDLAADQIYHYFWHVFADIIIEENKKALEDESTKLSAQWTLYEILTNSLKLLHPFVPYVTEEVWSHLPKKDHDLLMIEEWPKSN